MFVFGAAAIPIACERSMPAAVRSVRINNTVSADARVILEVMADIGSPFGSRWFHRLWITTRENTENHLIAADWAGFSDRGEGQAVARSSLSSQARAVCQSRSAVAVEISSVSAASSSDR